MTEAKPSMPLQRLLTGPVVRSALLVPWRSAVC